MYSSHSNWCEGIPYCGFNLDFHIHSSLCSPLVIHYSKNKQIIWVLSLQEIILFHFNFIMSLLLLSKYFTFGCASSPEFIYYFFLCSYSSVADSTGSEEFLKHLHFVLGSVFSELQLAQWQSQGFWYIMLLMASLWFLRLYLHYLSQWLFLQAISAPVTKWVLFPESQRDAFSSW